MIEEYVTPRGGECAARDDGGHIGELGAPCPTLAPVTCGHVTHTQSQWGSVCSSENAGCFRDQNFLEAYPEGLILGCGVLTANLVTSSAIEKALPSAGAPRALLPNEAVAYDGDGDPKVGTILFGQVVALGLNIGFDAMLAEPDANPALEALVVDDPGSPCFGMSVGEVYDHANYALGDCPAIHGAAVLAQCVQAINKSFASGEHSCSDLLRVPETPPQ